MPNILLSTANGRRGLIFSTSMKIVWPMRWTCSLFQKNGPPCGVPSFLAERITALFVKHTQRPGKYPDGGNLYLQVRKSTRKIETDAVTKSWLFRYSRFGKDTWLGLGPYPDVTLSEARASPMPPLSRHRLARRELRQTRHVRFVLVTSTGRCNT